MIKYPEVIAHFYKTEIKIISLTFETSIYKVIEQSVISETEEEILYKLKCSDNSVIELTLNKKGLMWYF